MKHLDAVLDLYCELVASAPVSVTAIRDPEQLRHGLVEDALTARVVIGDTLPGSVVDVGSGNGSLGIPLALHYGRPVTLLESVARKAAFLRLCSEQVHAGCPVVAA